LGRRNATVAKKST